MVMEENRKHLVEAGYEDLIVFDNPSYDRAIIGVNEDFSRVIYDFDLMVESLMEEGMDEEDAIEFIEYNTIRAQPYIGENAPIVMRRFNEYHEVK